MNEKKLKVYYTDELDSKLDKAIMKLAKENGWKENGSSFNFETKERDLDFYK